MAERGSYGPGPQLDIRQILSEAQHRWLRPAEICEILRNYEKFCIAPEPPNRPPSGSLLLFDRKVLRYFRKDGHNWRKKKDGKTVKEAHEKLKVGSVDVLHCYYAHGEENENFQRRSYWMLEQDLMHIVFVHYLEVKGNRTNIGGIRESDQIAPDFQDSPLTSSFSTYNSRVPCRSTDSPSPISSLTSLCEDADSEDIDQASSRSDSFLESLPIKTGPLTEGMDASALSSYFLSPSADNHGISSMPGVNYISHVQKDRLGGSDEITDAIVSQKTIDLASWEEVLEQSTSGFHTSVPAPMGILRGHENMSLDELLAGGSIVKEEFQNSLPIQSNWQTFDDNSAQLPMWLMDESSNLELTYDFGMTSFEARTHDMNLGNASEPISAYAVQQNEQPGQNKLQIQLANDESQCSIKSNSKTDMPTEGNTSYALTLKKPLLHGEEGLKKVDSFSRWVTKELEDVDDLHLKTSSGISWSTDECGNVVDDSSLSPSLSQDQHFSILDFSPKWAYTDSETEVLITGTFLKSLPDVAKCNWSCMFGEVEVPAEILANGVLCCSAPPRAVGQVPFYVTCSNRLACSEVREFDYRVGSTKDIDIAIIYGGTTNEMILYSRLEKLLSLRSISPPSHFVEGVTVKQDLISKIISLKEEEEYYQMVETTSQKDLSQHEGKEHLLKMLMKEKLYSWLLHKVSEDGKGPSVLDDEGQGVIHLAAALGYDWAIKPIVTAEVSINFRDINGWTALHWAAFCGREQMVAFLVSLGAAPGALTDPSPEFLLGRTPADLASGNGHKGISGFLAESSLTDYLKSLTMNDPNEDETVEVSGPKAVQTVSERTATPVNYGDAAEALSLRDSLTALCNATQAAGRIHQMFRMYSLQRKRTTENNDDKDGLLDERALSLIALKTRKPGQSDGLVHAAATQIQKKFRGWKERKEFLIIRQRIVKIQDTFPLHHLFKKERFADTEDDKIFHTCSFADPSDLTADPVQQWEGTSTEPIPHFPAEEGIEKRITSESQRMVLEVEAIDMKSNSGEKIGVEFEAFGQDKIEEIGIEPETSDMDRKTLSMGLEKCSDTIIQREVLQSCLMWGGLGLTEPPKDEDWNNAKKIYLMDNELSNLPKNPRSPVLSTLFLQRNYKLRTIPPSFFDYMPALQILNLSRTGIKSLPKSIIRLVSLKRLFLNDCHRFMILSPKVGELKRLEVLDIEGTDIIDLPNEIKELTNLKCLEVSFCTYLSNSRRAMQSDVVVPGGIILALSHLEELNMSMNPDDKRWNACVEDIVTEVCTLESLNTLKFYFPRVELVRYFLLNSPMWVHPSLSNFRFTVGYHVKRTMSRLPGNVEFELEQWERCLTYINGVAVPREIQKVLQYSTAFFLERHATIKKLSDFGIGNMKQLKCCVVGECNEVEVIIDATDVHEEDSEADALEEDSEADDHEEDDEVEAYREDGSNGIVPKTFGSKKIVLGSLEYLYIYYMKNLRKIWKGPVQAKCLSLLKSLTLRTCPQLTTIFTTGLLDNLYNLEELTVEDCPSIKTLVSCEISAEHKTSDFLSNLKRISLHYMPGLISISSGLHIAPRLEWLSFYNCPNLKHLLIEEVSSKDLKKIKGEWNWWVALKWRCGRPSYLDDIFVPINI